MLIGFSVLVAVIIGLGVAAALDPALVPAVPETRSAAAWTVLILGLACYAVRAGGRCGRSR